MDVGCKCRNDYSLIAAHEKLVEALSDFHFRVRMTGFFHVGGITQQAENPVLSKFSEPGDIYSVARNGRNVKLEVRCVDHHTKRCVDSQCNRIRDAVIHVDHFNSKAPQPEDTSCFFGKDLRRRKHIIFFQLEFDKRSRQCRGIDRAIHFFEQMCH